MELPTGSVLKLETLLFGVHVIIYINSLKLKIVVVAIVENMAMNICVQSE